MPDRARLNKMLLTGALSGLGCSVLLLLMLDRLDDRLNSFSEVTDLFEEDILGQIPRETSLDSYGRTPLLQPDDERHSFLEGYPIQESTGGTTIPAPRFGVGDILRRLAPAERAKS